MTAVYGLLEYRIKTGTASGWTSELLLHSDNLPYTSTSDIGNSTHSSTCAFDGSNGIQAALTALIAKGIFIPVSMPGAGARGASQFSFSVPAMKMDVGDGISSASLPELTLKTTDFDQIGQAPDTRTYWQKLRDLIIVGAQTIADATLQTAVWIVDQVSAGARYVGDFVSEYTTEILDGIQLALDLAGFIPGLGAIPDLLNAGIHTARGNYGEAALSLVAAVPGVGDAIKGTAMGAKAIAKVSKVASAAGKTLAKAGDKLKDLVKVVDDAPGASKVGDDAAEALGKSAKN